MACYHPSVDRNVRTGELWIDQTKTSIVLILDGEGSVILEVSRSGAYRLLVFSPHGIWGSRCSGGNGASLLERVGWRLVG